MFGIKSQIPVFILEYDKIEYFFKGIYA